MTIFQLLRTPLIGETPFAMTSFVQMAAYPNKVARGLLLTQAAQQIVGHHITWHNLEYVETRNPAHFIEFASDSGPFFGMDWQRVRCYPPRTERWMEIMS